MIAMPPLTEGEREITLRALRLLYAKLLAQSKTTGTPLSSDAAAIQGALNALKEDEE